MAKEKVIAVSYEGISFNANDAAAKPLAQFLKEQSHQELTKEQLTEVHGLAVKAVSQTKKIIKSGEVEQAEVVVTGVPSEVSDKLNKGKDEEIKK